jgi:hypothetical protein
MSCCGEKRKNFLNEARPPAREQDTGQDHHVNQIEHQSRQFEYNGSNSLTVTGSASGKKYHFRFHGDRQSVDYYDSFAMMAERELRLV